MGVFRRIVRGNKVKTWNAKFAFRGQLYRKGGFPDRETSQHWIDSTRTALRRGEAGYIKPRTAAKILPLVAEFADHLRSLKLAWMYCYTAEHRLIKLALESPMLTIADFTAAKFNAWRTSKPRWRGKVLGGKTLNQYLDIAQEFGKWLVSPKQLVPANPLKDVQPVNAKDNEGYRRAASLEELQKLIDAAPADRALFYRFLLYIPLRKRTYQAIVWGDVDLDAERPTLRVRPETVKGGRKQKLAIRADLAQLLRAHRGDAEADDKVFPSVPSVDNLRTDLAAAGVAFDDGKGGRRLDLHAFRKTCIRTLKRAGVPLEEAHVFLGHRDVRTTERYYDDDMVEPETSKAAEKMPSLRSER